jgi:hypothetical protein
LARNWKFESISLQQGVRCELDFGANPSREASRGTDFLRSRGTNASRSRHRARLARYREQVATGYLMIILTSDWPAGLSSS